MLFLVSGASCAGKSSVRRELAPRLGPDFDAVELGDLGRVDPVSVARRQELAEVAVRRAAALHTSGRHLLLCGDPVAPAEVIAAPSAPLAGGVAACVLDVRPDVQTERLTGRGDDLEHLAAHHGFAQWMREHAADPLPRLEVLTAHGAPDMRWDRIETMTNSWDVPVIDGSSRTVADTADAVHAWIQRILIDGAGAMHPAR